MQAWLLPVSNPSALRCCKSMHARLGSPGEANLRVALQHLCNSTSSVAALAGRRKALPVTIDGRTSLRVSRATPEPAWLLLVGRIPTFPTRPHLFFKDVSCCLNATATLI